MLVSTTSHGSFFWVALSPADRCPVNPENLPQLTPLWKEFQRGRRTSNVILVWTDHATFLGGICSVIALCFFWLWVYRKSITGNDWQRVEAPRSLGSCCLPTLGSERRKRRRQWVKEPRCEKKYRCGLRTQWEDRRVLWSISYRLIYREVRQVSLPLHLFLFLLLRAWVFAKGFKAIYKEKSCM